MNYAKDWYKTLRKPSSAPPSWVFGPVWTVLYLLIAVSFGFVGYQAYHGALPLYVLALFICNLLTNFAYSPIQFRLHNLVLATFDILLVWVSLILALINIYLYFPWVAWINIPYLLWVSFATVLQLTITFMNRDKWHA